jgi:hypothetical protein
LTDCVIAVPFLEVLHDRFRCRLFDDRYSRPSHVGCAPHTEVSPGMLRPHSGSAGPPVQPAPCDAGRMQPPYWFRGATPTPWLSRSITNRPGFHRNGVSGVSRFVSGGLDVTGMFPPRQRSVAGPDPKSCLPACEHSLERYLIPACYTCRSCSPVGSEARNANSDFANPPFPEPGVSP